MIKIILKTFILALVISGCLGKTASTERFKQGVFKVSEKNNDNEITITRIDSLQITTYTKKISASSNGSTTEKEIKKIDTLYIKWLNNFSYSLRMKNPKKEHNNDIIFVQINRVKDSSYDFTTKIGRSEFKQQGTLYIPK